MGISKERWIIEFLELDIDGPMIGALQQLGTLNLSINQMVDSILPASVAPF